MPTAKELSVQIENRPGALAKICRALATRGINIIALRASTDESITEIHFVVDNPPAAKTMFAAERLVYTETEVAQAALRNQPGELARAASRLAEAGINVNFVYAGLDPKTNTPLVFFGVPEAARAAQTLDQAAASAASS